MAKALIIQNETIVPPGTLLESLSFLKWNWEIVLMEENIEIPSPFQYDCLVLLGGTMNVDDTTGYPHLDGLRTVTAEALEKGFPVIGLCLGAQMMARAAGAEVRRNSCGETGWCQVTISDVGLKDPVLAGVPNPFEVFQWHDDSFEIPRGAAHLGSSPQCAGQIMRLGKNSYGFQCHIEVTDDIVTDWIKRYYREVEEKLGHGGPERLIRQTAQNISQYNRVCGQVFINYFKSIEKP